MTAAEANQRFAQILGDDLSDGMVNLAIRWNDRASGKKVLADIREMRRQLMALKRDITPFIVRSSNGKSAADLKREAFEEIGRSLLSGLKGTPKSSMPSTSKIGRAFKASRSEPYAVLKENIQNVIAKLDQLSDEIKLSPEYTGEEIDPTAGVHPVSQPKAVGMYLFISEEVKGPFSQEQLQALKDTGVASPETLCCKEGTEEWIPLSASQ
ncbi:uncharacterized protein DUF4339 [Roseimicrobium gellanilyticum]|uniref:Uncharacterized protein DUF4339 n=1 Tax=Roseimicrobium gellanilyticum TaxID=748857 RepID=A0A366HFZ8_9BACT|nr:DUF4339 domain-containing protein [Roseimicrobium gellanilyticum]RBP41438.1 uncharacterized protein DUF4339 [Roseimicrobium gellanilyticum]